MALETTTLYKFKADLQQLRQLNTELERAKHNLKGLKKDTQQYAAAAKGINKLSTAYTQQNTRMSKLNNSAKTLNKSGRSMVSTFKSASIAIVSAFAFRAIIGGIRGVITTFSKFEAQMAAVRAISGATDVEFKELEGTARELGKTTVFTAIQVAKLQEEFARLGFTTEEIIAAQQATLNLAAATGEDLARAAAIAGSTVRAFGFDADMTTRVTNVMGAAFTGSALNLERFTQSMKFVAPIAKTAGFTLEETSAMLMTLADAGLHGSIAGNALKNIFLKLGDSNSKLNKSLGKTVHGLPQLLVEMTKLKEETFGLTEATDLLDKRSAPAFLVLLNRLDELEIKRDTLVRAEGDITRMANIRLDTLEGDFRLLTSATEGLGLAIGETFGMGLRKTVYALTKWMQGMADNNKAMKRLEAMVQIVIGAISFLIVRLAVLRTTTLLTGKAFVSTSVLTKMFGAVLMGTTRKAAALRLGMTMLKRSFQALASATGIGLVLVVLTELISLWNSSTSAMSDAEFSMGRLHDSFRTEIALIQELNELSDERHDKLREFSSTHQDLLEGLDIELLSKKELEIVERAINAERAKDVEIQSSKNRIEQNDIEINGKIAKLHEEIKIIKERNKEIKAGIKPGKDGGTSTPAISVAEQVQGVKDQIAALVKGAQLLEDTEADIQKSLKDQRKKSFLANIKQQGIQIQNEELYRDALKRVFNENLELFREMSDEKKKVYIKDTEDELAAMESAKEFARDKLALNEKVANNDIDAGDKSFTALEDRVTEEGELVRKYYEEYIKSQKGVNVTIVQYKSHLKDLALVLGQTGVVYDKESALSIFKLQKTKDFLKEMLKAEQDAIFDTFEKRRKASENTLELKTKEIDKMQNLITANLTSISQMKDESDLEIIRKEIIASGKKYDVIKNMDRNQYKDLIREKNNNKDELLAVLDKMYAEELAKTVVNEEALIAIKKKYDAINKDIDMDEDAELEALDIKKTEGDVENMNKSLINFGAYIQAKRALALKVYDAEIKDLDARLAAGAISEEKHAALSLIALNKKEQAEAEIYQEKLAKFAEVYQQMSQMVMDFASNQAAFNISKIQEEHQQTTEDAESAFSEKVRIAELAGIDTEAMTQTHNDKMIALENIKDNKIRAIKKRMFLLEKANNVAMALINGAQAITKVSGQTGIGAIVAAPIMSALIAAQIAMILAQKFVGAKGGITPGGSSEGSLDKFANGGMVQGKSHAQGGEKFKAGGRVVELEGGEAVINKRSTALFKGQLSAMNSHKGYGKKFEQGGVTPGTQALLNAQTWDGDDIAALISGALNSQRVLISEGDITSSQSSVSTTESHSTVFM
tara:strand:+ start:1698 stop:5708 length:4011 start_codon:yes stop_codon:yes gene_type:complete